MLQSLSTIFNSGRMADAAAKVYDDTSVFLEQNDKRGWLGERKLPIDNRVLDQYELIDKIAPSQTIKTFRSALIRVKKQHSIASIVSVEQEIPVTLNSSMFEEILQNSMKVGLSIVWTESDLRKFYEYAESGSVPPEVYNGFISGSNDLQPRIYKLVNKMVWSALFTGRIDHVDSRTNAAIRINYDVMEQLFPAPLTGADSWDNYATARGLDMLILHQEEFYEINGYYPQYTIMRKKLFNHLARQQATADMALGMGLLYNVPAGTNALISLEHVNKILSNQGYGEIVLYDARYAVETMPRTEIQVSYCPDHSYCFASDMMAERLWTPTIEGLGKPGVHINNDPRERKDNEMMSKGVANSIVTFKRASELGGRRVIQAQ